MFGPSACPWDGWDPATMEFCERPLCGWITQPANTWSNLAYVVAGVTVLVLARREGRWHLWPVGAIALIVAGGSALFHGSSTFVGEVIDLGAMFLFSAYWLVLAASRLRGWSPRTQIATFAVLVAGSVAMLIAVRPIGIALFSLQMTAVGLVEIAWRRQRRAKREPRPKERSLIALCVAFAAAYAMWRLDFHRILCDRDNHVLQGHAAWHLLNSLCFYFLYRYLGQFPPTGRGASEATPHTLPR